MEIFFQEEAVQQLTDIALWYEEQQPGLGNRFMQKVDDAVRLIQQFPFAGVPSVKKTRRFRVPGFPYKIYYGISEEFILILAVFHDSRRH